MARKKSAPQIRHSRNRAVAASGVTTQTSRSIDDSDFTEAVEEERSRLMEAEAVLQCVLTSMDDDDGCHARGPYYPSVIGLARDLVNQSINQLDSVRLRPKIEKFKSGAESSEKLESSSRTSRGQALREADGVKECAPEYLH